ncbi:unnamed protein product [Amoebophrya sp. A25]|nr:unnamed protein product [Amoebophrya sp. A25]|eukprot:GSA25T00005927001.1
MALPYYQTAALQQLYEGPRAVRYLLPAELPKLQKNCMQIEVPDSRCPIGWEYSQGYCFAGHDYKGPCRRVETFVTPVYAEYFKAGKKRLSSIDEQGDAEAGGAEASSTSGKNKQTGANFASSTAAALLSQQQRLSEPWTMPIPALDGLGMHWAQARKNMVKVAEDWSNLMSNKMQQFATKCDVKWPCAGSGSHQTLPIVGMCPYKWKPSTGKDFLESYPTKGDQPWLAYETFFSTISKAKAFCFPPAEIRNNPNCIQPLDPTNFPEEGSLKLQILQKECDLKWKSAPPPSPVETARAVAEAAKAAEAKLAQRTLFSYIKAEGPQTRSKAPRPKLQIPDDEAVDAVLASSSSSSSENIAAEEMKTQVAPEASPFFPDEVKAEAQRGLNEGQLLLPTPFVPRQQLRFLAFSAASQGDMNSAEPTKMLVT